MILLREKCCDAHLMNYIDKINLLFLNSFETVVSFYYYYYYKYENLFDDVMRKYTFQAETRAMSR